VISARTVLISVLATFAAAIAAFSFLHSSGTRPASDPEAGLPSLPPPSASTDTRIHALQAIVRVTPNRADGYVLLAGAYLQKVRETGDAQYYTKADGLLARALTLDPRDAAALTERGALELARHDFAGGLRDALAARRLAPTVVKPFGVLVDALVELGRYRAAGRALQEMVDSRPDLAAYARVSYFRELHGDLPGAIRAMRLAAAAGGEAPENVAYVQALLGHLEFARGRLDAAGLAYREALALLPGAPAADAGLARVQAARGDLSGAIRRLRAVVAHLPLPEYVVALGDTELAAGRREQARRDLALVGAEERLLAVAGVNTDVDLALFEADHGSPSRAVALARRAWAAAPSVRSADALGWALTRAGRSRVGLRWARRALRLGSRDALFLYHAGMSARAAGESAAARRWLRLALAGNPRFSPLYAPRARRALAGLAAARVGGPAA
jgi:tetratricopeptide (TPR) repeat protein